MPLFGSKHDDNTTATTGEYGHHHDHTGPGPVTGGLAGGAAGHGVGHTGVGTALGAAAGEHHANTHPANETMGTTTSHHHGHTGPGPLAGGATGGLVGNQMGHTGAGTALGAAAGEHHARTHPAGGYADGVAPMGGGMTHGGLGTGAATATGAGMGMGHHNATGATGGYGTTGHTTGATGGGMGPTGSAGATGATEKAIVGKLEHAVGTALCSSTLRAKGLEKEREAQALKVQAAELGQAEGLEAEANARRERAVAHGAHPHNLNAGATAGNTIR